MPLALVHKALLSDRLQTTAVTADVLADNRAMVDALLHSAGKGRGIATVDAAVSDDELHRIDKVLVSKKS